MKLTDRAEQLLNSADTPTGLIVGIKIPVSDTVRISADLSSKMSGGGQKAKKGGAEVGTRRSRSLWVQALSFVHGMAETPFRGDIYQVWRNDIVFYKIPSLSALRQLHAKFQSAESISHLVKTANRGKNRLSPPVQRFIRSADIKSRAQNDRNGVP